MSKKKRYPAKCTVMNDARSGSFPDRMVCPRVRERNIMTNASAIKDTTVDFLGFFKCGFLNFGIFNLGFGSFMVNSTSANSLR